MEYVEKLIAAGRPDLAEQLRRTWRNAVMLCAKYTEGRKRYYRGGDAGTLGGEIPVGASKTGGYPDLPPEIPYPEMTGFARTYLKADPRWRVEIVPESSMQLLVQINLRELAESLVGLDMDCLESAGLWEKVTMHDGKMGLQLDVSLNESSIATADMVTDDSSAPERTRKSRMARPRSSERL